MTVYWIAFVWVAMAFAASLISIRVGLSVAFVEILVGAIVGNLPHASHYVQQTDFVSFLAGLGSIMLTFLAGAEIDPMSLKRHWKPACRSASSPSCCPSSALSLFAAWFSAGRSEPRRSEALP